jgi:hypothetical protein
MRADHRNIKPQSRVFREGLIGLAIDGRSQLGRYLRTLRAELLDHVAGPGGTPGVVQSQLIELALADAHQLALFQTRRQDAGRLTAHERREESAARGRFERVIGKLGIKPAVAKPPSLEEHLQRLATKSEVAA